MNYIQGNMWTVMGTTDNFLITTCAYIKNSGEVVMGRGIALEAKLRYPNLPFILGRKIRHLQQYGLKKIDTFIETAFWAFQVKYHFKDPADIGLITLSLNQLCIIATTNAHRVYDLNFPGIGNGKLDYGTVKKLIDEAELPDNVNVWTRK